MTSKEMLYEDILSQTTSLMDHKAGWIANFSNLAALLWLHLPNINWVGFYFRTSPDQLTLGPFQGKPACTIIPMGKGVCGTAASMKKPIIVSNVHKFDGHIACDESSASEIVIPILEANEIIGVLDIDSPILDRFDNIDQINLEKIIQLLLEATR
ncbi:MAG: GAF domain-containing protein [Bacilli bacterium]